MKARHLDPESYAALKTAFRVLVARVGGVDAAASVTRVGKSAIADYYNLDKPESFAPADVIADLEAVAREPFVTATLARLSGCRLAGGGEATAPAGRSLTQAVAGVIGQIGAVTSAVGQALLDGQVTPDEAPALIDALSAHVREMEAALTVLRSGSAR